MSGVLNRGIGRRRVTRREALRAGVLASGGTAFLIACGGGSKNESGQSGSGGLSTGTGAVVVTATPKAEEQARKGGGITVYRTTKFLEHDMHTALAGTVWHLIGSRAFQLEPWKGELQGHLAEKWEVPGDGTEMVIKVRPGIKIHNKPPSNGRDFTAEDMAFNINRIAGKYDPQNIARYQRASTLTGLNRAEAVDKTTVKVIMDRPSSAFFRGLAEIRNMMMPKDVVEQSGFPNNPEGFAGTGPFKLDKFEDGVKFEASRHPEYFVKDQPNLDTFKYVFLPDRATGLAAFLSGQIDMFGGAQPTEIDTIKKAKPDAQFFQWQDLNWDHLRYNTSKKPFDDFRIRKAIFLALDYQEIGDGYWGPGWGYTGPLVPAHPEALKADEVAKLPGYNKDTKEQDRQAAKQLMTAAGFPDGAISFGILIQLPVTVSYMANATRIKDQLAKVWPKMEVNIIQPPDVAAFSRQQAEGNFDAISYTITSLPDAVLELTSQYHSKGSRNYGKFRNADADAILDKAFSELDNTKRTALLKDFQKKYYDEWMPIAQLVEQPERYHLSPRIRGFDKTTGPWGFTGYRVMSSAGFWWSAQ
jgi:peptide/nickel transport system substrate-binding protein